MVEIRFHGRGGQGAVVASEILATALFNEGRYVQAFPAFGVERRGAPVMAFLRLDSTPIRRRCQVYNPDHVVVLDSTLISVVDVTAGLKRAGSILINSDHAPETLHASHALAGYQVATVPAGVIAAAHNLGSRTNPIVNTAILGAFARATKLVSLEAILRAIGERMTAHGQENMDAAREAYDQAKIASAMPATATDQGSQRS